METNTTKNQYLIPGAIVLAGILISGAVFLGTAGKGQQLAQKNQPTIPTQPTEATDTTSAVNAVTKDDHIKGNPDASIKIVEYSDFECPFCQRFHNTMNDIMKTYGDTGDIAWVFRQFPLDQLHPVKARAVAVASECANDQGGNNAFWKFTDRYYELTLTNNRTDIETVIPQIVKEIGLNAGTFDTCFKSGKFDSRIEADSANAVATGGRGTPWSIIIAPNGKTFPLNGAQPQSAIEQLIEIARNEK